MDEKSELSDIVLNKGGALSSSKKIILAIATLGVVLIIVIMLMNSINSGGTNNLPKAVLPPDPQTQVNSENELDKEPLFEDVPVVKEDTQSENNLDNIAKKLKRESAETKQEHYTQTIEEPVTVEVKHQVHTKQKTVVHHEVAHKAKVIKHQDIKKHIVKQTTHKPKYEPTHAYFIQVGSFSILKPNKVLLDKVTKAGFHYSFHKINNVNKVLVGPFSTRTKANEAKAVLRSKVVRGAFLVKLK